jgi:hypothetical protein
VKLLAAAALATLSLTGAATARPKVGGCTVFPATNAWNQRVDRLPVAGNSAQLIASIGNSGVHADFGNGLYDGSRIGIPYVVVHGTKTPKSRVTFDYADESDKGPYPIPAGVPIEGQPAHGNEGDRHALIVDRDACRLYELYALHREGGHWAAGSRCASPSSGRAAPSSTPRDTTPRTRPIRRCRRWGCACGSRRASTSRSCHSRRASWRRR